MKWKHWNLTLAYLTKMMLSVMKLREFIYLNACFVCLIYWLVASGLRLTPTVKLKLGVALILRAYSDLSIYYIVSWLVLLVLVALNDHACSFWSESRNMSSSDSKPYVELSGSVMHLLLMTMCLQSEVISCFSLLIKDALCDKFSSLSTEKFLLSELVNCLNVPSLSIM